MRAIAVLVHRWAGLAIAAFLVVAGVTGAVIAWTHELDALLVPALRVSWEGPALPALDLARRIEARDPRVAVSLLPLEAEPGAATAVFVEPRTDPATGRPFAPGYNQVIVDPATGAERGRREWGAVWPVTRATLMSFLYRLHYTLHLPALWGQSRFGVWLMGAVAMVWMVDGFVGLYLTLPPARPPRADPSPAAAGRRARGWWARWKPAWTIKKGGSGTRVTFDIHRAFSLWTWGLLVMLAFTAVSMNLRREVFLPLVSRFSNVTPSPYDARVPAPPARRADPGVDREAVLARAREDAVRLGWSEPPGTLTHSRAYGFYGVLFYAPGTDRKGAGGGPRTLYFDDRDGHPIGVHEPWEGTLGDLVVQAQFPLHSGRILGVPGRILVSAMGVVVAVLSVTGVVIWWRKRAARIAVRRRGHAGVIAREAPV